MCHRFFERPSLYGKLGVGSAFETGKYHCSDLSWYFHAPWWKHGQKLCNAWSAWRLFSSQNDCHCLECCPVLKRATDFPWIALEFVFDSLSSIIVSISPNHQVSFITNIGLWWFLFIITYQQWIAAHESTLGRWVCLCCTWPILNMCQWYLHIVVEWKQRIFNHVFVLAGIRSLSKFSDLRVKGAWLSESGPRLHVHLCMAPSDPSQNIFCLCEKTESDSICT